MYEIQVTKVKAALESDLERELRDDSVSSGS